MGQKLALFDFDGTLVKGDSIAGFTRFLYKRKLLGAMALLHLSFNTLKWRLGKISVEAVKSMALAPLLKLSPQKVETLCRDFVEDYLVPRLYQDGVKAVQKCAEEGYLVLLVSASPEIYLKHLALHLPFKDILATQSNQQHQVVLNMVKEEKVRQIRTWLQQHRIEADWEQSLAFGDSANDLPMLRLVGNPTLVNPNSKAKKLGKGIKTQTWR